MISDGLYHVPVPVPVPSVLWRDPVPSHTHNALLYTAQNYAFEQSIANN